MPIIQKKCEYTAVERNKCRRPVINAFGRELDSLAKAAIEALDTVYQKHIQKGYNVTPLGYLIRDISFEQELTKQQVATDIGTLVEITSNIKGKTAKFKREMEKDLDGIEESVKSYQDKLIAAVSGIENGKLAKVSVPEEVKSSTTETAMI